MDYKTKLQVEFYKTSRPGTSKACLAHLPAVLLRTSPHTLLDPLASFYFLFFILRQSYLNYRVAQAGVPPVMLCEGLQPPRSAPL